MAGFYLYNGGKSNGGVRMKFYQKYLLTFFKTDQALKPNQLIHVLHGKRTPSILYLVEMHELQPLFEWVPQWTVEQLQHLFQQYVREGWLTEQEAGFILTTAGQNQVRAFNQKHDVYRVNHLRWANNWASFFNYWLFLTQIYSEASYASTNYRPLLKASTVQQQVKHFLASSSQPLTEQAKQWQQELFEIFSAMPSHEADFLSAHLPGHNHPGLTRQQLMVAFDLEKDEYLVQQAAIVQKLLDQIFQSKGESLHSKLLQANWQQHDQGLSKSTWQSLQLLQSGQTVNAVASKRHLKVSTIYEHILEVAFVHPDFNYQSFLQSQRVPKIKALLEKQPAMTYQAVREVIPEAQFMEYRLLQLAHWRKEREDDSRKLTEKTF